MRERAWGRSRGSALEATSVGACERLGLDVRERRSLARRRRRVRFSSRARHTLSPFLLSRFWGERMTVDTADPVDANVCTTVRNLDRDPSRISRTRRDSFARAATIFLLRRVRRWPRGKCREMFHNRGDVTSLARRRHRIAESTEHARETTRE